MGKDKSKKKDKGKSSKKKKDPLKPKAAMTSYLYYSMDNRAQVVAANPGIRQPDVVRMLGETWKALTPEAKRPYEDRAVQDRARFNAQMTEYKKTLPAAAAAAAASSASGSGSGSGSGSASSSSSKGGDDKKAPRKRKRDPNAPKRARSAYMYFASANKDKVHELIPEGESNQKYFGVLSVLWKDLDEEAKAPYIAKAEEDKERARIEMEAYKATKKASSSSGSGSSSSGKPKKKKSKPLTKKRARLPGQPKRAMSSYMIFNKHNRQRITDENPGCKNVDLFRHLAAAWAKLSPEQKQPYETEAKLDKERYAAEMELFKAEMKNKPAAAAALADDASESGSSSSSSS